MDLFLEFRKMQFFGALAKDDGKKMGRLLAGTPALAAAIDENLGMRGPAVYYTLRLGKLKCVEALLDHGVKTDFLTADKMPLLRYTLSLDGIDFIDTAAERSWLSEKILKNGADIEGFDGNGLNLLMNACLNDNAEAATFLLDKGANPDTASQGDGSTVLMLAVTAQWDAPGLLDRIIDGVKDAGVKDVHGSTALHYTTSPAVALRLIERGADPFCLDDQNRPALRGLTAAQREEVMAVLDAKAEAAMVITRQELADACHVPIETNTMKPLKLSKRHTPEAG